MDKYQCQACGHVYDPALGDPASNCPEGTVFADLPANWTCPDCGSAKNQFVKPA